MTRSSLIAYEATSEAVTQAASMPMTEALSQGVLTRMPCSRLYAVPIVGFKNSSESTYDAAFEAVSSRRYIKGCNENKLQSVLGSI